MRIEYTRQDRAISASKNEHDITELELDKKTIAKG